MISIIKNIIPILAALALLLLSTASNVNAAGVSTLRNPTHNDINPSNLDVSNQDASRKLSTVYSYEYKYQKMVFCWKGIIPWYCYDDTDYRWCVQDTQNSCFPNTIGQNEFWDDDRIKHIGNGKTQSCSSRTDIGTGSCSMDSSYKDWTGTACSGKSFDVYQC